MLQHTSSEGPEVIIIQLQINLNSEKQLYGLGTNEIDWQNDKNMLIIEMKFLTANVTDWELTRLIDKATRIC